MTPERSSTIDFSELFPERLRVKRLPDGSELELMHRDELGPEEVAAVKTLDGRVQALQAELSETDDQDEALRITTALNDVCGEMLQLIAVDLADETLRTLKMGQRGAILRWWGEQMPNGAGPKVESRPKRSSKRRG